MTELVFATMGRTIDQVWESLLLARSLRSFGGSLAAQPFWLLIPTDMEPLPASLAAKLAAVEAQQIPFPLTAEMARFPFAAKTLASGFAETRASAKTALLAWMDPDSLFVQEPAAMLLPEESCLGYRPVDHTLIGSPYDKPLDAFWSLMYARCRVTAGSLPPMRTSVDERWLRPYFNAGLLVVRPQSRLLRTWSETFTGLCTDPDFAPFYEQDALYRIFMHQAVLAGVALAQLAADQRLQLPYQINYPLHMHAGYPRARQVACLNDLVSCRYDTLKPQSNWEQVIPIHEPLLTWLAAQQAELSTE